MTWVEPTLLSELNWRATGYQREADAPDTYYVVYENNEGTYDIVPDRHPEAALWDFDWWYDLDPITAQAVLIHLQSPGQWGL
jgi:hypothetical protein